MDTETAVQALGSTADMLANPNVAPARNHELGMAQERLTNTAFHMCRQVQ